MKPTLMMQINKIHLNISFQYRVVPSHTN